MGFFNKTGGYIKGKFLGLLQFYIFSISVIHRLFRPSQLKGINKVVLYRQILFTGFDALLLIGFIAASISILIIIQVHQLMGEMGRSRLVHQLMVMIVVHQLSCLLTAMVVVARSGTAISTELGNMVVHNEIDLLHSFGISPRSYLVVPRVTGVVVSIFILTLYFNFIAMVGGAVFSGILYDINIDYFFSRLIAEFTPRDIFIPVIKSLLFGFAVGLISCYQGLQVTRASTEVPWRTMRSVVYSVIAVIFLNILVTIFSYTGL